MNAIQMLAVQPWVERLGWTLLHFLWQGVLIAAVYAGVRKWMARSSPNSRYALACAAMAGMAAAPVITWSVLGPAGAVPLPAHFAVPAGVSAPAGAFTAVSLWTGVARSPEALLPWVVAIWLAGAMACWLRLLGGWMYAAQLRSRLVRPAPREWQAALDRLKGRVRVARPVRLLVSSLVQTPAVVGWLRPVVLAPVGALTGLPAEQVEALLLHELAHIRRHDYLVNMMQSVVETLLFYHPAVWWVSGHMRTERELCCDDVAVSVSGDALAYARALVELESARPAHLRAAVAATGGSLGRRIARLVGQPRPAARTVSGPGILVAAMLVAAVGIAVFGQPAARPKFEVASVKPSLENRFGGMVRPLPGRLTASATVRLLMQSAYTAQAFQIVGGPAWMDSERFEIEGKTGADASPAQMFLMLQSLLEDRFKLKIHRETRELPAYDLVAARSGPKLPPPKAGSCASVASEFDRDASPAPSGRGRVPPPQPGQPPAVQCGSVRVMLASSGARMQGGQVPMPEFIRMLSMVLGRTVIDKTGVTGLFDVEVGFLPDETTPALPPPPPGALPESASLSILTAIQEQLGLRLQASKGPDKVIVVDHVERPSAN